MDEVDEKRKSQTREVLINLCKTVKVWYSGTKTVLEPNSKYIHQGYRKASPSFLVDMSIERIRAKIDKGERVPHEELIEILEFYHDGRLLQDIKVDTIPMSYKIGIEVE
jgi:hypothetical protein